MDDFPRIPNAEGHVDCQSWMYLFSQVMGQLAPIYGENSDDYESNAQQIKLKLQLEFIDEKSGLCKDFNISNGVRRYSGHFGYPSILPLAFGMLDEESPAFN